MGEDNKPIQPTADWGLHYPDDDWLFFAWQVWRKSGYAVYPDGKSFDEQDASLISDFFELESVYGYQVYKLKNPQSGSGITNFSDL